MTVAALRAELEDQALGAERAVQEAVGAAEGEMQQLRNTVAALRDSLS